MHNFVSLNQSKLPTDQLWLCWQKPTESYAS